MSAVFAHVADLPVAGLAEEAARLDFAAGEWRQKMPFSPHVESETIVLRGPKTISPRDVLHSLDVIAYPALDAAPAFAGALRRISEHVGPLARAMIIRLKPGGRVAFHTDTGTYAEKTNRYHLPVESNPDCWLEVAGEGRHLPVGQLWWFNKHLSHAAGNDGATPRIHLVVDSWAN